LKYQRCVACGRTNDSGLAAARKATESFVPANATGENASQTTLWSTTRGLGRIMNTPIVACRIPSRRSVGTTGARQSSHSSRSAYLSASTAICSILGGEPRRKSGSTAMVHSVPECSPASTLHARTIVSLLPLVKRSSLRMAVRFFAYAFLRTGDRFLTV